MNPRTALLLLVAAAGALVAPGCASDPRTGYTTESLYRGGIDSVAVPIFQRGRGVYRRNIEDRLTEALIKRIELDTPYKVTDKARADTLLEGTLSRVSQRVLSRNPDTGRPREMEETFAVALTWTDLRTGEVLVRRTNVRASATYIPPDPFGEDFFQGSEDLVNRMARRIVEEMEADW